MEFFKGLQPIDLVKKYGSPLYVYNEDILRERCRQMVGLCKYKNFKVNYSVKANTNLAILQIARSEGVCADAMSVGEIEAGLEAGFSPDDIFFIPNNVCAEEMQFAIKKGITL
ncbi:MAG: diaminopimelate decarboxylase, partial [Clostridiales bacterium]|nr:diaminopimelate decarboxylase [Clostridiales bacterium]